MHRSLLASAALTAAYPAAVLLLTGCGTTEPGPERKANPIPEQLYQLDFAQSTNDCGSENLAPFKGLVIPQGGGTSLLGLDTLPIPSVLDGDQVTFSQLIPLQGDTTVTFGGKWAFAEDRHTFDGAVTYAVSFGGPIVCTFTFATAGQHGVTPQLPTAPTGEPEAGITASEKKLFGRVSRYDPAVWGRTAPVIFYGAQPCFIIGASATTPAITQLTPPVPFPNTRDTRVGSEVDVVAFRWQLYGYPDLAAASLSALNATLGHFETSGLIRQSDWFWQYASDSRSSLIAPQDWIDFGRRTTYSQSGQTSLTVNTGYWFIVEDVYWFDRDGLGSGWSRNVVMDICQAP